MKLFFPGFLLIQIQETPPNYVMLWVVMARPPNLGTVKAQRTFLGTDNADMKQGEKQWF